MARPVKWTPEKIAEYKAKALHDIAIKGLSLRKFTEKEDSPSMPVILEWLSKDKEFSMQYARACEARAEKIADEILNICDSTEDDIIYDENNNLITNHNVIQRDRLRVDTRKWLLSKLFPKKYGDKIDVTTDGDKINNISQLVMPDFMKK